MLALLSTSTLAFHIGGVPAHVAQQPRATQINAGLFDMLGMMDPQVRRFPCRRQSQGGRCSLLTVNVLFFSRAADG